MHTKLYIAIVAVIIFMLATATQLLFGQHSIPRQHQVEKEISLYQAQVDSLQEIIEQHKAEIERLKKDSLYKENILRTRYGMSRKDEKVFQMVK